MKLHQIANNMTEVETNSGTIFFSYETPVAYERRGQCFRTSKRWSVTTTRHINKWLDGRQAAEVDQETLDAMAFSVEMALSIA